MSMFTRRNYVWLASVARDILRNAESDSYDGYQGASTAIMQLADALATESPDGFDRDRFIKNVYDDPVDHDLGI